MIFDKMIFDRIVSNGIFKFMTNEYVVFVLIAIILFIVMFKPSIYERMDGDTDLVETAKQELDKMLGINLDALTTLSRNLDLQEDTIVIKSDIGLSGNLKVNGECDVATLISNNMNGITKEDMLRLSVKKIIGGYYISEQASHFFFEGIHKNIDSSSTNPKYMFNHSQNAHSFYLFKGWQVRLWDNPTATGKPKGTFENKTDDIKYFPQETNNLLTYKLQSYELRWVGYPEPVPASSSTEKGISVPSTPPMAG